MPGSARSRGGLGALALAVVVAGLLMLGSPDPVEPPPQGKAIDRADPELRLRAVPVELGIEQNAHTWGARVGDLEGDGRDDLVIAHHKRGLRLYRNEGGRFADITTRSFREFDFASPTRQGERDRRDAAIEWHRDRHDCLPGDVNRDGRADIYCTVGGYKGSRRPNPNELWLQRSDGSFAEVARRYGVEEADGRGRFAAFVDANLDRWPDLFVGSEPGVERPAPNRLYINRRGRGFREAPEFGVEAEIGANSAEALDFDGDGREDLLICTAGNGPVVLYRNVRGVRFKSRDDLVQGDARCRFAGFADVDGDDDPDLIALTSGALRIWLQRDGRFGKPSFSYPVTRGKRFAVGDVAGDGLADIYVVQTTSERNLPDALFVNRGPGSGFARVTVPQGEGLGQSVTAIDHDGDGDTAFVTMNGLGTTSGPIRAFEFAVDD